MTRPIELAVRAVALTTGLLTITIGAVSQVIGSSTSIYKMTSSIIGPSTLVAGSRFWSLVVGEVSPTIELPASIINKASPATRLLTPIAGVKSLATALPSSLNLILFLSFQTKQLNIFPISLINCTRQDWFALGTVEQTHERIRGTLRARKIKLSIGMKLGFYFPLSSGSLKRFRRVVFHLIPQALFVLFGVRLVELATILIFSINASVFTCSDKISSNFFVSITNFTLQTPSPTVGMTSRAEPFAKLSKKSDAAYDDILAGLTTLVHLASNGSMIPMFFTCSVTPFLQSLCSFLSGSR